MQGDAVALAVEDDGAKAVRADRGRRFEDASAVRSRCGDGLGQAPLGVEIDQRTARRRCVVARRCDQTARDLVAGMGEQAEREAGAAFASAAVPSTAA